MSVFVFDKDTLDLIRYTLAMQRFNDYTVGPQGLKEHLCVTALERVLTQTGLKFPKFQKENPRDVRIHDIVKFLQQKNLVSATLANGLSEYVAFHDDLLRVGAPTIPAAEAKAQEILRFLCTEAAISIDHEIDRRDFKEIANLKTKQANENDRFEVTEADFDCLDKLYEKCPSIQQEIEKRLTVPLKSAPISVFAPNTGGIWLPFVIQEAPNAPSPHKRASVGVTFTPVSVRIGLNFGSQAHKYKIKYYELLSSGELMNELESLSRKATGYCLCDTFWHYHIRNIQSLQWCLTLYSSTRTAIEEAIQETKQLQETPLTANRYLISKVIERRPEDFAYIIRSLIDEASKDLNELYPVLALIDKA